MLKRQCISLVLVLKLKLINLSLRNAGGREPGDEPSWARDISLYEYKEGGDGMFELMILGS